MNTNLQDANLKEKLAELANRVPAVRREAWRFYAALGSAEVQLLRWAREQSATLLSKHGRTEPCK